MILYYILCSGATLLGILSLIEGVRAAAHIRRFRPRNPLRPDVIVFCPCKGTDDEFQKNVASILDQDYAKFRVVFVVESHQDPAFEALRRMGATVLVAGEAGTRGQKVHNLLYAVQQAGPSADVFVFCDADARFPRDWLVNLTAPLADEGVGVCTGYRWYVPTPGNWPSLLRSVWNASVVTLLGPHGRNFAWGGSMALRREVFERIGVAHAWEGAVSDDYAVTRAAREAHMRIVFAPACLVPSYGDCSWRELLEFTTRQIIITRVYEPRMWRTALITQTIFNAALWGGIALAWVDSTPLFMAGLIYILAAAKGWMRLNAVESALPSSALSNHRWSYILGAPLSGLLYEYNLLRSAFTRDIEWRQIRYSLISPHRTVVRRGVES